MHRTIVCCLAVALAVTACAEESTTLPSPAPSEPTRDSPIDVEPEAPPESDPAVTIDSAEESRSTAPPPTETTVNSAEQIEPAEPITVVTGDGELFDDRRGRRIPYRVYAPAGSSGSTPVILVSHGGMGSERGYTTAPHLGSTLAAAGFLAIHVGHVTSTPGARQVEDRPADVTAVLDAIATGDILLPETFAGEPDLERVGHTGHSFGAYTSHAVGGADYGGAFRDGRIDAIAPISPQGPDQFGAFDRGRDDNTWITVQIPSYNLIGGSEIDTNAVDTIDRPGWRRVPFERYRPVGDKFLSVIDGQEHSDMWRTGEGDVPVFVAEEIARFFSVYVAGDETADACAIGVRPDLDVTATIEWIASTTGSQLVACGD